MNRYPPTQQVQYNNNDVSNQGAQGNPANDHYQNPQNPQGPATNPFGVVQQAQSNPFGHQQPQPNQMGRPQDNNAMMQPSQSTKHTG